MSKSFSKILSHRTSPALFSQKSSMEEFDGLLVPAHREGTGSNVQMPRIGFLICYFGLGLSIPEFSLNVIWSALSPKYLTEVRALEWRQTTQIKAACVDENTVGCMSISTDARTPYTILSVESYQSSGILEHIGSLRASEKNPRHFFWNNYAEWHNIPDGRWPQTVIALSKAVRLFNRMVHLLFEKGGELARSKSDLSNRWGLSFVWKQKVKVKLRFNAVASVMATLLLSPGGVFCERFTRDYTVLGEYHYVKEWLTMGQDDRWRTQRYEYETKREWLAGMAESVDRNGV